MEIDPRKIIMLSHGEPLAPRQRLAVRNRTVSWHVERPRSGPKAGREFGELEVIQEDGERYAFDIHCQAAQSIAALVLSDLDRDVVDSAIDRLLTEHGGDCAEHAEGRLKGSVSFHGEANLIIASLRPNYHFAFKLFDLGFLPVRKSSDTHVFPCRVVSSSRTIAEAGAAASRRPRGGFLPSRAGRK